MYYLFIILIIIVAVLLTLIVMVQNSKGGGLAAGFTSANQYGGVVQTNKFLEKATWALAVALLLLSLFASMTVPKPTEGGVQSIIQEQVNNTVDYNTIPTLPQNNTTVTGASNQGTATGTANTGTVTEGEKTTTETQGN